jgi:peptide/nickel transport system permease protein
MGRRLRPLPPQALAMFGLVMIVLLFALAFVGPYLTSWKYTDRDFEAFLQGPSTSHWFGTTQTGADVYALTLRGMQKSLIIGLLVALCSTGMARSSDRSRATSAAGSTAR